MNISVYIATAFILALSACGHAHVTSDGKPLGTRDKDIDVKIVNGKISVPEDPAYTVPEEGAVKWTLPAGTYTFPRDGIVIDPGAFHPCGPIANGRMYRCVKKRHVPGQRFEYVVNVNDGSTPLVPLDPWIYNR